MDKACKHCGETEKLFEHCGNAGCTWIRCFACRHITDMRDAEDTSR